MTLPHGLYRLHRESIYVIHAFQKKSKAGIATPKSEVDLVRQRLKLLRSEVKNAKEKSS